MLASKHEHVKILGACHEYNHAPFWVRTGAALHVAGQTLIKKNTPCLGILYLPSHRRDLWLHTVCSEDDDGGKLFTFIIPFSKSMADWVLVMV